MAKKTSDVSESVSGVEERIGPDESTGVTPEERHRRVAMSAYLRAAAREFRGGDSMQDWLEAEAEVDEHLKGASDTRQTATSTDKPTGAD